MSFKDLRAKRDARLGGASAGGGGGGGGGVGGNKAVDSVIASMATSTLSPAQTSTVSTTPSASTPTPTATTAPVESTPAPSKRRMTTQMSPHVSTAETKAYPTADLFPELKGTGLEVRVAQRSGRGLYATKAIKAGE